MATIRQFSKTIASAATLSAAFQIPAGYSELFIEIPGLSATTSYLQASRDGTTYRHVYVGSNYPISVPDKVEYDSAILGGTPSGVVIAAPRGFEYYKLETEAAIADGATVYMTALY